MTIVISSTGTMGISISDLERPERVVRRQSIEVYMTGEDIDGAKCRFAVMFSGTVQATEPWKDFGVPNDSDDVRALSSFALAAVGEYLDDSQLTSLDGTPDVIEIKCLTYDFDKWRDRKRATDDEVDNYLRSKGYWSWRFERSVTEFSGSDTIRLGVPISTLERIAMLGDNLLWNRAAYAEGTFAFVVRPELIRSEREARLEANYLSSDLAARLSAPRYSGAFHSWAKSNTLVGQDPPDYANGLKEAVSAVESLARVVTGRHNKTLGELIAQLRADRKLDPALAKAFDGLWGFVSNSPGVRHGGVTPPTMSYSEVRLTHAMAMAAIEFLLDLDK